MVSMAGLSGAAVYHARCCAHAAPPASEACLFLNKAKLKAEPGAFGMVGFWVPWFEAAATRLGSRVAASLDSPRGQHSPVQVCPWLRLISCRGLPAQAEAEGEERGDGGHRRRWRGGTHAPYQTACKAACQCAETLFSRACLAFR